MEGGGFDASSSVGAQKIQNLGGGGGGLDEPPPPPKKENGGPQPAGICNLGVGP